MAPVLGERLGPTFGVCIVRGGLYTDRQLPRLRTVPLIVAHLLPRVVYNNKRKVARRTGKKRGVVYNPLYGAHAESNPGKDTPML